MIEGISRDLKRNGAAYQTLLADLPEEEYRWKQNPNQWCLLELVCHLYDEEREDFRARAKHILETPNEPMPSIDPQGWVASRDYMGQDYSTVFSTFLEERKRSVEWLESITEPQWDNVYHHESFGEMTAKQFLSNWVAHDYLHIRQILKIKFGYLKEKTGEDLLYAGEW